jgi:hypothetical protein
MKAIVTGRLIELPSDLEHFFDPDEEAEVARHRDSLSLWRLTVRSPRYERGRLVEGQKPDSGEMFWRAYQRVTNCLKDIKKKHLEIALCLATASSSG